MNQLQAIILSFVALGAIVSLIGLSAGLYELVTGRLVPVLTKLRRRVPATDADLRQNAVAIVLNEVAALLMALLALEPFCSSKFGSTPSWRAHISPSAWRDSLPSARAGGPRS
jgi:hypothetical protein